MKKYVSRGATVEGVVLDFKDNDSEEGWTEQLLGWLAPGASLGREGDGRLVSVTFPLREGSTGSITARHGDAIYKTWTGSYSVMSGADFEVHFQSAAPLKAKLSQDKAHQWRTAIRNAVNGRVLFISSESYVNRDHAVRMVDEAFPGIEWDQEVG